MHRIGPITTKYAVERTDDPAKSAIEDSIRWAVRVENAALTDFFFAAPENEAVGNHYQLLGAHHHLSALNDTQIERARSIFADYADDGDELDTRLYRGEPAIDVTLPDLDVADHVDIAMAVFESVYNIAPADVAYVERTTHEMDTGDERSKVAVCDACATSAQVRYMLRAYGDVYYECAAEDERYDPETEYDFVFSKQGWWVCANCLAVRHSASG